MYNISGGHRIFVSLLIATVIIAGPGVICDINTIIVPLLGLFNFTPLHAVTNYEKLLKYKVMLCKKYLIIVSVSYISDFIFVRTFGIIYYILKCCLINIFYKDMTTDEYIIMTDTLEFNEHVSVFLSGAEAFLHRVFGRDNIIKIINALKV